MTDQPTTTGRKRGPKTATKGDAENSGPTAYEVAPGRTVGGKGPGETIELDDEDALRLYELGFILDEDGNRVGMVEGPKTVSGVEIKEV